MNKEKMIFICHWGRNREQSWSGTKYAVYKGLEKFFEIESFDFKYPLNIRLQRVRNRVLKLQRDISLKQVQTQCQRDFEDKYRGKNVTVFQFDEFPMLEEASHFIYQDMCVSFLCDLQEKDPFVFSKSNFTYCSREELSSRRDDQKKYYENCKAVFCMGQWLADYLVQELQVPAEKVFAVGAGCNVKEEFTQATVEKTGNKILFVGVDFDRKGGPLTVEAFRILREKYIPDAELYIIGPQKNPVGQEEGIHFLGKLDYEETAKYFQMCDLFCMPSYFEAYGIAFCEALCFGLPCIARNSYSMPEIIGHGKEGFLIDQDDKEQLALYMKLALQSEEMTQYVIGHKSDYLEKYSWNTVTKKMADVIKSKM